MLITQLLCNNCYCLSPENNQIIDSVAQNSKLLIVSLSLGITSVFNKFHEKAFFFKRKRKRSYPVV